MKQEILDKLAVTKLASKHYAITNIELRNYLIKQIWEQVLLRKDEIIAANLLDLQSVEKDSAVYDRLLLTENRILWMAQACEELTQIGDPLRVYDDVSWSTNDWLLIRKQWVALWVVACIYEARPNVTIEIAIMALKSGNWVVLRWSKTAYHSNEVLINIMKQVLKNNWIDENLIMNYPTQREYVDYLCKWVGLIDVIIPRGWKELITFVQQNSMVPVIETWAWVVHIYLTKDVEEQYFSKAIDIIVNAKTSRPSVCNALDSLLIDRDINEQLLKKLFETLIQQWVKFGVENIETFNKFIDDKFLFEISSQDYYTEYLSLNMNVKFVDTIEQAVEHIWKYSSAHSEAIITQNISKAELFKSMVDSSVVYVNTSTRFSDWWCFGFGWEVGISTNRLHARWPMWADALITYKYVVESDWKCR